MFKNYAEDLLNENIVFDEDSINEIRTLINKHEDFFVDFEFNEIEISKKSLNKIFSILEEPIEEKILFSIRVNEIEDKEYNYKQILIEKNKKILKEKEIEKLKKKNINNKERSTSPKRIKPLYYKAESLRILKNPTKEFKKELKEDNINENLKDYQSDDEFEKRNLMSKFYPVRVSTDKQNISIINNRKIKYLGFIGENLNLIIFVWYLFYILLILMNIYTLVKKILEITNYYFSYFLFFSFFFDFNNFIIGIIGIFHINKFHSLSENDDDFNGNKLNLYLFFSIIIESLYFCYIFYFSDNILIIQFSFVYHIFFKYCIIGIIIDLILCFFTNLQIEQFYINNNKMILFQESLL